MADRDFEELIAGEHLKINTVFLAEQPVEFDCAVPLIKRPVRIQANVEYRAT
tara:strand:+ start:1055 stop:1210 length:156 start_codon:yes stop_codon:yes gene_type:complete